MIGRPIIKGDLFYRVHITSGRVDTNTSYSDYVKCLNECFRGWVPVNGKAIYKHRDKFIIQEKD